MAARRGEEHHKWKGGKSKNKKGYIRLTAGEERDKMEHRMLWERANGPIPEGMDVHHINEVRYDNRLENFELRPSGPHRTEAINRYNSMKRKGLTSSRQQPYTTSS